MQHLLDRYIGGEGTVGVAERIDRPVSSPPGLWMQLVAERDGLLVAALTAGDIFGKPEIREQPQAEAMLGAHAELINLAVHPDVRGQRLGHRLLVEAEQRYTSAGYRCLSGEFIAKRAHLRNYYREAGFEVGTPGGLVVVVFGAQLMCPLEPHAEASVIWKVVTPDVTVVDFSAVSEKEGTRLIEQAIRDNQ
ncbi:GNAT family N-acetyltransferase [Streptomyces sp. NBC_01453]|uniref:GNAT family N-acetyltransferase n=1 Tax=Streptomyces sp. NBC_01453 TaxID=2903873 RepID=UPI002E2BC5CD|nr:GNAT family N-acetyltransferase [Streptomyces sp. NBC_01453]